ncbi:MAG: hypothetical protein Q9227_004529 [Pyrenula ochraceoflavens]
MTSLEDLLNPYEEWQVSLDSEFLNSSNSEIENSFGDYTLPSDNLWSDFSDCLIDPQALSYHDGDTTQSGEIGEDAYSCPKSDDDGRYLEVNQLSSGLPSKADESTTITTAEDTNMSDIADTICLGMIYRVAVKLSGSMEDLQNRLTAQGRESAGSFSTFKVQSVDDKTILAFEDDTELGTLNLQVADTFKDIIMLKKAHLEARVDLSSLLDIIERAAKANEAILRVNIDVYCLKECGKAIGRTLSDNKLFLQRPDHQYPLSIYSNPHVIQIDDVHLPSTEVLAVGNKQLDRKPNSEESFQQTVSEVYASLRRATNLRELESASQLKTHLLPYELSIVGRATVVQAY